MHLILSTLVITTVLPIVPLANSSLSKVIKHTFADYLTESQESKLNRITIARSLIQKSTLALSQTDADLLVDTQDLISIKGQKKIDVLKSLIKIQRYARIGDTFYTKAIARSNQERERYVHTLQNIIEHERYLHSTGNTVLYHATTTYPYSYIDTQLALLSAKLTKSTTKLESETLLLRQPKTAIKHILGIPITQEGIPRSKEEYIQQGVTNDRDHIDQLIACTPTLTGNLLLHGEALLSYWNDNINMTDITIDIKDIINKYQVLKPYSERYMSELQQAINLYQKSSQSSTLLQMALPLIILKQYAYISGPYGTKLTSVCIQGKPSEDIEEIVTTLSNNPFAFEDKSIIDRLQIRLCLTDSILYEHLKVYSYNSKQDNLKQFKTVITDYTDTIKAHIDS